MSHPETCRIAAWPADYQRYGIAKDVAQKQVDEFTRAYKADVVVRSTAKKARA